MNIYEYEDSLKYKVAVMQAALEGKQVEYFCCDEKWCVAPNPSWNWANAKFRIAKPKEKSILEWLQELPEGYRERAIRNYDENFCGSHDKIEQNISSALRHAFDWHHSPETYSFWYDVYCYAMNTSRKLPPLPVEPKKSLEERLTAIETWISKYGKNE